jgi:HEAT repeat protein
MPRPYREWTTLNCTISPEVDQFLRQQAATLGIDTGTVLDAIVWRNHLQPSEKELKGGKLPPEVIERCFAEEALALLEDEKAVQVLDDVLDSEAAPSLRRRRVLAQVRRWQKTRQIPQESKEAVRDLMNQLQVVPLVVKTGAVNDEWFDPV